MSEEKILITHASTQRARFLNYEIHIAKDDTQYTKRQKGSRVRKARSINGTPILSVPKDVVQAWTEKHTKNGKPTHRGHLIRSSDFEIIKTTYGGLKFQGLVNYYTLAHDVEAKIYPLKGVMMESLTKTLAGKHKTRTGEIYKKYKRTSEEGRR